jgi:hypothetical protein
VPPTNGVLSKRCARLHSWPVNHAKSGHLVI